MTASGSPTGACDSCGSPAGVRDGWCLQCGAIQRATAGDAAPHARLAWLRHPLALAWIAGALILGARPTLWREVPVHGSAATEAALRDSWTPAWWLAGSLVVASGLWVLAATLGPRALMVSPTSLELASGTPSPLQAALGTGLLRGALIVGTYLLLAYFAFG